MKGGERIGKREWRGETWWSKSEPLIRFEERLIKTDEGSIARFPRSK